MAQKKYILRADEDKIIGAGKNLYMVMWFYHDNREVYLCRADSEEEARNLSMYNDSVTFIVVKVNPDEMPIIFSEDGQTTI